MRLRDLLEGRRDGVPGGDRLRRVRLASTRVALTTTAIVAGVYVAVAVCVVLIVGARLVNGVDNHLVRALQAVSARAPASGGVGLGGLLRQQSGATLEYWLVTGDGTQYFCDPLTHQCAVPSLSLPAAGLDAGGTPQTISMDGASYRVAGEALPPGAFRVETYETSAGVIVQVSHPVVQLVVGESMSAVESAQGNLILTLSLVGPVLLIVVFLGAMTIGRRVAEPIELARVRQLEFTADASHELRTPLSVIEAQTSLALSEPRDAAWYRAAFQRVQGESGRIRHLVEDLLWLARFDSTRHGARAEHVDLGILAQQAVDRFAAVAEAKRLRLALHAAPAALIVQAPPEWLDRLLGVLLDNACKYAPVGGSVDVSVWGDGGRVRLTVDDSGPGIPAAERMRIFDRFHRATDREGGAGLGLAIADSVVRATGGRWSVGESPTGGASMGVVWSRSLVEAAEPEVAREAPSPAR